MDHLTSHWKRTIGLPSWLRTAPIPTWEASQSISKTFSKLGSGKTGVVVILVFTNWNSFQLLGQLKRPLFETMSIRAITMLKFRMKRLQNEANPWKLRTSLIVFLNWPVMDGFNLYRVNLNSLYWHNIAKENQVVSKKWTFFKVDEKLILPWEFAILALNVLDEFLGKKYRLGYHQIKLRQIFQQKV